MRTVFQIGFQRNKKRFQSIDVFVNNEKLQKIPDAGMYLTTHKDYRLKGESWFFYETFLSHGDSILIVCKTFLTGIGTDNDLTFESLYSVDKDAEVLTVDVPGVGLKGYPIAKGRIVEVASVSEDDKHKQDIFDFLEKGF